MNEGLSGSKAENLKTLRDAGYNVPPFYVVPAETKTSLTDAHKNKERSTYFKLWLRKNSITAAAIRSSSSQEDTKESSFAGQFTTILDIRNEDTFTDALKTVLLSKASTAYSSQKGSVHAIVQEFIEADISGVIFSVNPANGNNEIIINVAKGRGTQVVDGIEAEQYFVDRFNPRSYTVLGNAAMNSLLTQDQVHALSELTLSIESLFSYPQDIEWAIKDGKIYLLQARPITKISHLRLWDSSNISESFPGIVLPLTFSVAKRGYLLGYKAQAYAGGLSWYELEAQHRNFDSMIGIFNGKMYYNLLSWYRYIALFPGSKKNQQFLDDQIATEGQAVYQSPRQLSVRYKIRYAFRLIRRVLFFKRELNSFYNRFAVFETELQRIPAEGDAQLLMQRYEHIEQTIIPHFGRTLDNDFLVMTYHGWLKKLLQKWLPEQPLDRHNIIGAIDGVMSAKQALTLYELAAEFQHDKKALKFLQQSRYSDLESYIEGTHLSKAIQAYIETFGHRFAEDQKIESANPTLETYGIYKLLKVYAQLDSVEVAKRLKGTAAAGQVIETRVKRQLHFGQRLLYALLLRKLKQHLRLREKNRLLRGKVYGYMRELFPKIGRALVEVKVINSWEDIYYLQIEEIYELMQGALVTNDLQDRIKKRRDAYREYADIAMPERFITTTLPSMEKVLVAPVTRSQLKVKERLPGLISSPGTVEGRVVVLREPKIPDEPYDILVASHTDPGWTPLIALAKGVIVEHGGMLSHAAIVTRELGIPSIIGVKDVTSLLKTGMRVRINTQTSEVEILRS